MKCPIDNTTLAISERQGIEVDYCMECRGVWLDRGELDKLIAKSEQSTTNQTPQLTRSQSYGTESLGDARYDRQHDKRHYKKKRRESFLEDLFDF